VTILQRVIVVITLVIGAFFLSVFQASLTAALATSDAQSAFRSIEDVKSCKIAADRICFPDGTAADTFWDESIASSLKAASCLSTPSTRTSNISDGFNVLNSNTGCDFFFAPGAATQWSVTGLFCKRLSIVGSPFYDIERSFVLSKGSPLTTLLTRETLRLRETGRLQSASEYTKSHLPACPAEIPDVRMTWEKLTWFFILSWLVLIALLTLRIAKLLTLRRNSRTGSE
jgi:hypothetical protein